MRQQLTIEAARIMAEEGIADFSSAKRKAANRLGAPNTRNMPCNAEIEQALAEHQQLFRNNTQPECLRKLREMAIQIMHLLTNFNPHLVGPVLRGTADVHSRISLHVFTDTPEEVGWLLIGENIPYQTMERTITHQKDKSKRYPGYRFMAGNTGIEVTVFPVDAIRQAPPSVVDGKPMPRASLEAVKSLLTENNTSADHTT